VPFFVVKASFEKPNPPPTLDGGPFSPTKMGPQIVSGDKGWEIEPITFPLHENGQRS